MGDRALLFSRLEKKRSFLSKKAARSTIIILSTSSNQFNQIEHTTLFNTLTTIGIQSFTQCLYKSVALEWVHLLHILHELKEASIVQ